MDMSDNQVNDLLSVYFRTKKAYILTLVNDTFSTF